MSSILFSTKCNIKQKPYQLRICIDNDSNEFFISTIDDILLIIDNNESTSNAINLLSSLRIHFESLVDKKKNSTDNDDDDDDIIPEIIIFSKLINIKQTEKISDESNSSSMSQILSKSTQVDLSYIDISELFIWTIKRIQLEIDSAVAHQLCLISTRYLSKLKHRPRNLLVFVNSECGKGTGHSIYEEKVLPLFEEANIHVNTIYTERANHARDYVHEQPLDNYDGLVSVGGDGMFSELCHSLLLKTAEQAGLDINDTNTHLRRPNLRIGVIPAGSTDAVAFGTTGYNDPITSALQIIVGESLLIDICTVHSECGFVRFMATMLAYGFFGNVIRQSDNWRFFGPIRYILAGFFQFIRNTSYHVELTITQASEKCNSKTPVDNSLKRREVLNKNSDVNEKADSKKSSSSLQIERKGRYKTINCLNMPGRCDNSKYGMSPSVHLGDGSFDLILVKRSWRLGFLRFLHHAANDRRPIEELSSVERFRVTDVVIHPIVTQQEKRGDWACDGELITANKVRVRAHHQVLNLFASGIHLDQIKKINKEDEIKVTRTVIKEGFQRIQRFIFHLLINILTNVSSWQSVLLLFLFLFLFFVFFYFFLF